jgi:diaminohydroxyphosphoribosylaminopyrimidine deaminase/5-amino-6-(5-phosphoribosylamino)uracil reductase
MPLRPLDRIRLLEALALAETSFGLTEPNPRVGCILGRDDGRVLGRGATQQAGGPHAEVVALREARAAGHELRGATAWVTLEPCAHHGRTPPCCDALVEAGLARVVVAAGDPNPLVGGRGLERLRAAGIEVARADDHPADADIAEAAREINIGFFSRMTRGRPFVRMKIAASLDGRTALPDGTSQWITGEAARRDGHAWRRRAGAVLTGIGTVLEDDPRLDVRLVETPRQPLRVVVDSRLQLPPAARILAPPGRVRVYAALDDPGRRAAIEATGAEVVMRPGTGDKVDLPAMLGDLGAAGVNELHIEAGEKLNGSLLRAGVVDELLVYLAPCLLGPGREMAALAGLSRLDERWALEFVDIGMHGSDLRVRARLHRTG